MSESSVDSSLISSGTTTPPAEDTSQTSTPETTAAPETKPEAETKAEAPAFVPLTADALKFPEGVTVDEPIRDELLSIMNNQELAPAARAQALADLHLKAVTLASEKGSQAYQDLQKQWKGQAEAEFGERLDPTLGGISKLIDEFAGTRAQAAELRDLFALTGAGNSPSMIRFLDNVAKKLVVEGRPVAGTPSNAGKSAAEILYPNQAKG